MRKRKKDYSSHIDAIFPEESSCVLSVEQLRDKIVKEIRAQSRLLREPEADESCAGEKICWLLLALAKIDNMSFDPDTKKPSATWRALLGYHKP